MDKIEHIYEEFIEYKSTRIIECKTCGFKHVYPIPSREQIEEFYRKEYYNSTFHFDYSVVNEEYINKKLEEIESYTHYRETYEKVCSFKQTPYKNMLDIGCGNELLVRFFQNRGWSVWALEPSRNASEYLRKFSIPTFNITVEQIENLLSEEVTNLSFVNIQFVFEHLRDPHQLLRDVYHRMVPGGIIRICVPNDFSEGQRAYWEYYNEQPYWVQLPDHINYFNFRTLRSTLLTNGFEEVYCTTIFPLEFLLLGGINYYGNPDDAKKVGPFVNNFEQAFIRTGRKHILEKLYESLAQAEFGRSIIMYAIKK
ncbi:class I SAM-dependent methyltransferase [Aneurinibacillus danicus]|uniref:Type 12 methyltransferase n=1 Tax=Aneurinibacillus danicus TaxID=267746 RepID=A0A511VE10_9BACL|nr:class I SAM-dependent methyltransferase [Aneurinibacillus danicus]GEN36198.1 type 12 methyltransferase [Aneurinibacillus danicus]